MTNPLEFYATPGLMSSPGNYASKFDRLLGEVKALVQVVQGLMIHIFWADQ